jgi:hypothetical protein
MIINKFPVKLINYFKGNPLDLNYLNSETISSFVKADNYVDKSIS